MTADPLGEALIVWSARIMVLFYGLRLAADFLVPDPRWRDRLARLAWTAGCAIYLAHFCLAFQFLHGWSHAAALAHTARRTFEVTGINWGGGIYINYAFTVLWVSDVVWWWIRAARHQPTPAVAYWTVHAVFVFMFFNATVVFGPPFWKWIVLAAAGLLVAIRLLLPRTPHWQPAADGPAGHS
jgi:hypothetical protein